MNNGGEGGLFDLYILYIVCEMKFDFLQSVETGGEGH
jgi:hypothetical protein